ncbi:nicotinamide-nucleotide adenylyltransferase [Aeromonas phage 1233]|nr:nicotinamide-nucleotide adenylyltransferase [Aeromonas phage 1233]
MKEVAGALKKTRGWLTGKFCMLHMGHINLINQASTMCDELVVVMSHSDHRFKDPRLSFRNKMLWLRTTFRDAPHIKIVGIDETDVPEYPNGWQAWSDLVKAKIGTDFDYIFTSETCDEANYKAYFPNQQVVVVDAERKGVDISATRIREDMSAHWGMMPTIVRKDFVLRICVVGTESCGKTTLTKMLAKRYQTSWVEEYGRVFCEQDLCMDEDLLEFDDYGTIAARRYDMEQEAAMSANRVLFVDTAALSTNYFCLLYCGREHPMVSAYQEREKYDLFLYLTDDVEFVEDGLRKNRNRDNTRFLFEKMLYAYAERQGAPVVKISGNYHERLNKAIEAVDSLLKQPMTIS